MPDVQTNEELFKAINNGVDTLQRFLPPQIAGALQFKLLGFSFHPMLPPMKKRINEGGFLDLNLPTGGETSLHVAFQKDALSDFLALGKNGKEVTASNTATLYSAMAELASYEALVEVVKGKAQGVEGTRAQEALARSVSGLAARMDQQAKTLLDPQDQDSLKTFSAIMKTHFTIQFKTVMGHEDKPVETGSGQRGSVKITIIFADLFLFFSVLNVKNPS